MISEKTILNSFINREYLKDRFIDQEYNLFLTGLSKEDFD